MANFKTIVNLCREKNIKLIVFISPSHATQWEAIKAAGKWNMFENWKRELVKVVPVWDFSGYNIINNEPIQDVMENYVDNAHYTPPIGDLILNRILGYEEDKVPADFGVLITPEKINSHLAKIRADREKWVKNNPSELELVTNLQNTFEQQLSKKDKIKIIR